MELLETHGFHCDELEASDSEELDAGVTEELEAT